MKKIIIFLMAGAVGLNAAAQSSEKLTGDVIGTTFSVDYTTGSLSTSVNTKAMAFDGDMSTYFASYDRSFTWTGLDLSEPYIITRVGWAARNDSQGPKRMELGIFQGANQPDFSDAVPIYLIPEPGKKNQMMYADLDCSLGFRYVRYVGPRDARCNVAEIEFYGYPGIGDHTHMYQPTNIPLVVVNTPNMEWFHEDDKEYAMEGSQVYIIADGIVDTDHTAQIRGRGNASWGFPKKPFRIKFDKKQRVLGAPAKAKKWTMINNYGDKTLMRNMLAFEISRRIGMPYTPFCQPVDLIFNGEYQGTYQLCDQIEVNPDRVNITEMKPEDTEGEALTGGYLIEIDAYASGEAPDEWFTSGGGHSIPVTIKSPDPGVSQQYNYIKNYFTQFEKAVFSTKYTDPQVGYRRYLDLESFLKHFIVGELSGNTDTYWSVYMSLDRGSEKFVTGPCWDFDLAFENDGRTYPINNKSDFICFASGSWATGVKSTVNRIIKYDSDTRRQLSEIWSDARYNKGLTYEDFDRVITDYSNMLYESQKLNFKRWNIMNTYVHQNPRIWGSYDAEVQNIRNYLRQRFIKLDTLIGLVEIDGIDTTDKEGWLVSVDSRVLTVVAPGAFTVANMQGAVVATGSREGRYHLAPGIYIVSGGGNVEKILVR